SRGRTGSGTRCIARAPSGAWTSYSPNALSTSRFEYALKAVSVCVRSTPGTRANSSVTTCAIWSYSATRTMATRSHSPETEYTSATPSMPASFIAACGISLGSHLMRTMVVITRRREKVERSGIGSVSRPAGSGHQLAERRDHAPHAFHHALARRGVRQADPFRGEKRRARDDGHIVALQQVRGERRARGAIRLHRGHVDVQVERALRMHVAQPRLACHGGHEQIPAGLELAHHAGHGVLRRGAIRERGQRRML